MYEKHFTQLNDAELADTISQMLIKVINSFDKRVLELKYFETIKIDMNMQIDKLADQIVIDQFKNIYYDSKRIASKSIKFMLENKIISEKIYKIILDSVINLLLEKTVDPETVEKDIVNY